MAEDADAHDAARAPRLRDRQGLEHHVAGGRRPAAGRSSPHYNSTVNGKTAYPVVADAETYELNRLQLTNTSIADTTLTLGPPAHQPR